MMWVDTCVLAVMFAIVTSHATLVVVCPGFISGIKEAVFHSSF